MATRIAAVGCGLTPGQCGAITRVHTATHMNTQVERVRLFPGISWVDSGNLRSSPCYNQLQKEYGWCQSTGRVLKCAHKVILQHEQKQQNQYFVIRRAKQHDSKLAACYKSTYTVPRLCTQHHCFSKAVQATERDQQLQVHPIERVLWVFVFKLLWTWPRRRPATTNWKGINLIKDTKVVTCNKTWTTSQHTVYPKDKIIQ